MKELNISELLVFIFCIGLSLWNLIIWFYSNLNVLLNWGDSLQNLIFWLALSLFVNRLLRFTPKDSFGLSVASDNEFGSGQLDLECRCSLRDSIALLLNERYQLESLLQLLMFYFI